MVTDFEELSKRLGDFKEKIDTLAQLFQSGITPEITPEQIKAINDVDMAWKIFRQNQIKNINDVDMAWERFRQEVRSMGGLF